MGVRVPPGFRFVPTDEELISYFLARKVKGLPVECDRIIEKEVYGDNATPWKVFGGEELWNINRCDDSKKKTIYVFSKLSKVGNSNKKICRVAGCGTWEGKSVSQNVRDLEGRIVGKKRQFTFKPKKGFESEMREKGHWIMHELSIDGYDYVVCRITRDLSKGFVDDHKKKEEEETICDDDRRGSCRKRKLADGSEGKEEEEDGSDRKKLCGGAIGIPSVEQDDLLDISFLFDNQEEEGIFTNSFFSDADRLTSYVQDLEKYCVSQAEAAATY